MYHRGALSGLDQMDGWYSGGVRFKATYSADNLKLEAYVLHADFDFL